MMSDHSINKDSYILALYAIFIGSRCLVQLVKGRRNERGADNGS